MAQTATISPWNWRASVEYKPGKWSRMTGRTNAMTVEEAADRVEEFFVKSKLRLGNFTIEPVWTSHAHTGEPQVFTPKARTLPLALTAPQPEAEPKSTFSLADIDGMEPWIDVSPDVKPYTYKAED